MYRVDYKYYKEQYRGKLSESDFIVASRKASYVVDGFCFGRLANITQESVGDALAEKLNDCICEVCDKLVASSEDSGYVDSRVKSSESVGGWSVSYASGSVPKSVLADLRRTVSFYLDGSWLTVAWC